MRGRLRIAVDAKDLRYRASQRVAARRPGQLRIEVLGPFGQIAAVLVTDGDRYQFFDPAARSLDSGLVTPGLLWERARVDLRPDEVVALLLGALRAGPGLTLAAAERFGNGWVRLRLDDRRGLPRQRFEFDARGQLRLVANANAAGELDWEARFDDYREVDGRRFAFDARLSFPRLGADTRLRFSGVELDPELPDEVFQLQLPPRVSATPERGGR
jgi:outer membrane lipoprotein-sorting protein